MTNETHSYEDWKAELIRITKEKDERMRVPFAFTVYDPIAKEWYNDGWTPEAVFRETHDNECDS